jgi:hypothetical protein
MVTVVSIDLSLAKRGSPFWHSKRGESHGLDDGGATQARAYQRRSRFRVAAEPVCARLVAGDWKLVQLEGAGGIDFEDVVQHQVAGRFGW